MTSSPSVRSAAEIEAWFRQYIARLLGLDVGGVLPDADFESFGIDSVQGVDMVTALEGWLGLDEDLPLERVFDATSISEAARNVAECIASSAADT